MKKCDKCSTMFGGFIEYAHHRCYTLKEWNRFNKVQKDTQGKFTIPYNGYNFNHYSYLEKRHEMLKKIGPCCINEVSNSTVCENCEKYDEVEKKYPSTPRSLDTITGQEILLSRHEIILIDFEPKWTRWYHAFTAVVNQKNVDKSISSFNKAVNAFSGGMGDGKTQSKQDKKNHNVIFGKSSKKSNDVLFGKSSKKSNDVLFGKSSKNNHDTLFGKSSKNNHDTLFGKSSKNNHDALFGKSKSKRKSKKSNSLNIWGDDNKTSLF